jgi:hypothetical protein
VSGLPSTARKKLAARLGAWAEIRACALNRSPKPSLADRDRRRGSAPALKLPHRAARKRGTSSERNCACFALRLASGSPPGELHWIMRAAPRRLRSPPQEDRRCAQACAAKGVSSLLPAERLFPVAHCGYPSASAGVVQWQNDSFPSCMSRVRFPSPAPRLSRNSPTSFAIDFADSVHRSARLSWAMAAFVAAVRPT